MKHEKRYSVTRRGRDIVSIYLIFATVSSVLYPSRKFLDEEPLCDEPFYQAPLTLCAWYIVPARRGYFKYEISLSICMFKTGGPSTLRILDGTVVTLMIFRHTSRNSDKP